ncbi:hypothetical protein IFM89_023877 [Coptis chinensis]|uniref:Uncharacterized protein n=1 Tax=Coptis chinensis TaxID=261450 RepID=A0A835LEG6_9MAGN|nr:hypothetical protein IFM89_023877 [Coptis chinensis]
MDITNACQICDELMHLQGGHRTFLNPFHPCSETSPNMSKWRLTGGGCSFVAWFRTQVNEVICALSTFLSHIALRPRSLNSSLALWPERSIRRVNNPMSSVRFCSESHLLLQELQRVENENPLGNNVFAVSGQPSTERPTPQMPEKRTLRVVLEILQRHAEIFICTTVDPVEAQTIDELAKQVVRTLRTKPGNLEYEFLTKKRHGRKPKFETRSLNSTLQPELNIVGRLSRMTSNVASNEKDNRCSSYKPFKSFLNETESLISKEATCSKSIVRIDKGRMGGYGYKESLIAALWKVRVRQTNKLESDDGCQQARCSGIACKVSFLGKASEIECFLRERRSHLWINFVAFSSYKNIEYQPRPYETSELQSGYCGPGNGWVLEIRKDVDRFNCKDGNRTKPKRTLGYLRNEYGIKVTLFHGREEVLTWWWTHISCHSVPNHLVLNGRSIMRFRETWILLDNSFAS